MDSELVVRGKPLSKDETKSLLGLIEINKIITSKTTNATNNKLKAEEWVRLTNRFNATATVHRRTPQQLRLKWENLKKNARKRSTKIRMNRIQTGGGAPEYIPPDDVLDRVADLLGCTASGFVVPFGGDKEPEVFVVGGDGDGSGEGAIGEHAEMLPIENRVFSEGSLPMPMPVSIDTCLSSSIPVSIDIGKNTSITDSMENVIEVTECEQTSGAGEVITLATPRRLTLSTPRIGDEARLKWKYLRDQARKEMRKTRSDWEFLPKLKFLTNQFNGYEATGAGDSDNDNIEEEENYPDVTYEDPQDTSDVYYNMENQPPLEQFAGQYSSPFAHSVKDDEIDEFDSKPIVIETDFYDDEEEARKAGKECEEPKDEDIGFFNSLIPHVKKLGPAKKLMLRMKIQELVYNTVYNET